MPIGVVVAVVTLRPPPSSTARKVTGSPMSGVPPALRRTVKASGKSRLTSVVCGVPATTSSRALLALAAPSSQMERTTLFDDSLT